MWSGGVGERTPGGQGLCSGLLGTHQAGGTLFGTHFSQEVLLLQKVTCSFSRQRLSLATRGRLTGRGVE